MQSGRLVRKHSTLECYLLPQDYTILLSNKPPLMWVDGQVLHGNLWRNALSALLSSATYQFLTCLYAMERRWLTGKVLERWKRRSRWRRMRQISDVGSTSIDLFLLNEPWHSFGEQIVPPFKCPFVPFLGSNQDQQSDHLGQPSLHYIIQERATGCALPLVLVGKTKQGRTVIRYFGQHLAWFHGRNIVHEDQVKQCCWRKFRTMSSTRLHLSESFASFIWILSAPPQPTECFALKSPRIQMRLRA